MENDTHAAPEPAASAAKFWLLVGVNILITLVVLAIVAAVVYSKRIALRSYFQSGVVDLTLAQAHDQAVISAVKKADPAVVSIVISKEVPIIKEYIQNQIIPDPFGFGGGFSIQVPYYQQQGTQLKEVGGGSGFLISANGLIVTNNHVVSDPKAQYTVYTNDGTQHDAKVVAQDSADDIAVIQITGNNFPFLTFDDSSQLVLGQSVIAIGNALGEFRNTVSTGVVSGLSRSITAGEVGGGSSEALTQVIQTDAAINPGNSGGPLLDLAGNVIGMNVALAQGSQSIGFALPGNIVKQAVASVKANGAISFPYIGVRYTPITASVMKEKKLPIDHGELISAGTNGEAAVLPGSPAAKVGLVAGDIILTFNGVKLTSEVNFSDLVRDHAVGEMVTLTILHNNAQKTVSLQLAKKP